MKKTILNAFIMCSKCFLYVFILQLAFLNFGFAVDANGQYKAIDEVSINLPGNELTVGEFFQAIQQRSPFRFTYDTERVNSKRRLSFTDSRGTVEELLKAAASQSNLSFRQINHNIDVYVNAGRENSVVVARAEAEPIRGKVTDAEGEALVGVAVLVKGTTRGTVTDIDGAFMLDDVETTAVLVFSYVGFRSKEVEVAGRIVVNVELDEDLGTLGEVVVVGYGTQKKATLTGAVSQVGSEVFDSRPITNINAGIQGTMPGVTITGASGPPGQNAGSIRIRGIGTWGNATPLVVIDGVPGGNLNILNPDDIESISVLKDAASSSIYGVRGANGVIVITTKKGTNSRPTVQYTNYLGWQTPTALPEFLGSPDYMTLLNESLTNVGRNPTYTQEEIDIARSGSDPNYYANTNWINEIYKRSAPQQNHSFSLNGGDSDFNYFVSYAHLKEGGLIAGDNFSAGRHNLRTKFNAKVTDRLEITANIGYIERTYTGAAAGTSPIGMAHSIIPLVPVRFTTGTWGYIGGQSNPLAVATDGGTNDFASQEFTGNLNAVFTLVDGLTARGQYGMFRSNSKRTIFTKTINYFSPEDGSLIYRTGFPNTIDTRDYTGLDQSFIGTLEYDKLLGGKHDVKAMLGVSQEQGMTDNFQASRTNLASQVVGHINLGTENQLNSGSATQWALRSFFGRANYTFQDKYLAEVTFRYDGSSRFSAEQRWELFKAASLGWVFSEESFFEGLRSKLEFGKIRASYGTQGNDRIGDYAFMDILGPVATMPIGNTNTIGYRQTVVANRLLRWETAIKRNIGIDLAFMNNRLDVTADYFINESDNLLLTLPLPDVFGAPYPTQNAGKVENRGWEMQVGWRDQIGSVKYGLNFNMFDVRNRVTDLAGTPPTIGDRVRMVGQPLDAFYGLVAERIAQEDDFRYDPELGRFVPDFPVPVGDLVAPGDIIYKDLNGDGVISLDEDRQVIGSHIPRYTFGLRGNASWNGFDFSFFLQGVGKADGYLTGNARHAFIDQSTMPRPEHLDRWTPENTDASYPRLAFQQTFNQRLSTYWLEDAAYLRLKNIQVGYTIPAVLTERARVSRLRVYASADNLLTFSNFFYGYDPESPVGGANFYPQVKTFVVGLNMNFK
ncbi:MAG: TonB-dependent receptor [Lunatimonas sp.]|uniref:SusC/RagA family TonB-linked outer membrane protein n=1 Tax=Lunatimonas sp. TaxID=2060141 RepID=UPI00263A4650|nr:TonB-dependent receptor [Lunatimonas sp.]MCC5938970.1 TonB-dependent receptor [Lunatimonas sp.]